ncbi:MAG: DUF1648 domain-containing protein [Burkholderiales bacterium]
MGIVLRMLFVLAVVVAPILVWTTSAELPARVASHFGSGGMANGFMSRDAYMLLMIGLTTLLPLVVVASLGFVPRLATSRLSIKNREHWLAPSRREETMATLASCACAVGIVLILFLLGMHFLTVEANGRTPPRLDESTFFVVLVGFLVLLGGAIAFMAIRFGHPRSA